MLISINRADMTERPSGFHFDAGRSGALQTAAVLPWLASTAESYFLHLFGSATAVETQLAARLRRPGSEHFAERCRLLSDANHGPIGGYFLVSGAELAQARALDLVALFRSLDRQERARVAAVLDESRDLAVPVAVEAAFVSALGLLSAFRGYGLGRRLITACIEEARAIGAESLLLTVEEDNAAAVRLYEGAGFSVLSVGSAPRLGLRVRTMYLRLVNDRSEAS